MGVTIGMPSMKLNNAGNKSKSCGGFAEVTGEGLDRHGKDKDIDTARADQNEYIGYQTAEELIAYSNRHIEEMNASLRAQGKRGIRADAVVMCSTIIKPPAHWISALSEEDRKRFINDAIEGIKTIIPEENIKSIAIHRDEQGDHAHVFWEPMTADGRLSAKECHNLKFFGRLNREMPAFLREKGWDIDDCKSYDAVEEQKMREELGEEKYAEYKQEQRRNRGVSSAQFKAEAEAIREELEEDIIHAEAELYAIKGGIEVENMRLEHRKEEISEELGQLTSEIGSKKAELAQIRSETEKAQNMLNETENRLKTANTRLQSIHNAIEQAEKYYHVICDGLKACDDLRDLIAFVKDLAEVLRDKDGIELAEKSETKRISLSERIKGTDRTYKEHRTYGARSTPKKDDYDDR